MHILDMDEESINKYLKITGQTRKELEEERERDRKFVESKDGFEGLKGVNPELKDKFNGDPGFEIIEKIKP